MSDYYDPVHISRFYDAYGEREWARLASDASPANRVNYHIHKTYLERYIHAGSQVLEAGAGAGRFTIDIARLEARITVGDISPGQHQSMIVRGAEDQATALDRWPAQPADAAAD